MAHQIREGEAAFTEFLKYETIAEKELLFSVSIEDHTRRFYYYFPDSVTAVKFSEVLSNLGINGSSGKPKHVTSVLSDKNFGVILTIENTKRIETLRAAHLSTTTTTGSSELTLESIQLKLKKDFDPMPQPRHSWAKEAFRLWLSEGDAKRLGSTVTYIKAKNSLLNPKFIEANLDSKIFWWSETRGIQFDIKKATASLHLNEVHLFSLASQFNGAEAPRRFTPKPGEAMKVSEKDNTQGPLGQRTNPILFEGVNAFLANGGFNQLTDVFTYNLGNALSHGYLTPTTAREANQMGGELSMYWEQLEQPCISSLPADRHSDIPIYLMLGAAPALGQYIDPTLLDSAKQDLEVIQYYAALASFTAQFNQTLTLALNPSHAGKTIFYHPTGVGLGVFGNDPQLVGRAFQMAALTFQARLKEVNDERTRSYFPPLKIHVQFEVFYKDIESSGKAFQCVKMAGLSKNESILK